MNVKAHISDNRCLSLDEAAERLHITGKTLAGFLRANSAEPPLFAKPGRDYIISATDLDRIYEAMKQCRSKSSGAKVQPSSTYVAPSEARVYSRLQELTRPYERAPHTTENQGE